MHDDVDDMLDAAADALEGASEDVAIVENALHHGRTVLEEITRQVAPRF